MFRKFLWKASNPFTYIQKPQFFKRFSSSAEPHYHYYPHHRRCGWFGKFVFWGVFFPGMLYMGHRHYHKHEHEYNDKFFGPGYDAKGYFEERFQKFGQSDKKVNKAVKNLKSQLDKISREKGPESKEAAMMNYLIGTCLLGMEAFEEASIYLEKAKELGLKLGGETTKFSKAVAETISLSKENKSTSQTGDMAALAAAVEIVKKFNGENSREYAQSLKNLGSAYLKTNDVRVAIQKLEEAQKIFLQTDGAANSETISNQYNLGLAYKKIGENDKAKKLLEEAFNNAVRVLGDEHPQSIKIYSAMREGTSQ